MLTNLLSATIVTLGVAVGVGVPFFAAHLEATHAREREHERVLTEQHEVLIDYEAELEAYRRQMAEEAPAALASR